MSNEQVVVLALWWLKGEQALLDIEDIAICADELAPGRFRWRKYTQHINIQFVGKALRDAKQHGLAAGTSARGWILTPRGAELATALLGPASSAQPRRAVSAQERNWRQKERLRLLGEAAYSKAQEATLEAITERELLRFFRLDEYITGETRRARVARITQSFGNDPDLGPAVVALAERVPL